MLTPIAVLGAGSWGTALALLLARNGQPVRLWSNDIEHLKLMSRERSNQRYLPGHQFPECLSLCFELGEALAAVEDVLIVVPSFAFKAVLAAAKPYFLPTVRLVWGTKGLDPDTSQTFDQVARDVVGSNVPLAVLSGPSFASEVADGLPTAVTIASKDDAFSRALIGRFHNEVFQLYPSRDVLGVELCGVVKNVLAIATGLCDGLSFGANMRSALVTRGMAELARLLSAMGGDSTTLLSLAGIGDVMLTCTTNESRNRRFGLAVGNGMTADAALKQIGQVVEGYTNAAQLHQLAQQHQVNMPIVTTLYQVLYQHLPTDQFATALLSPA